MQQHLAAVLQTSHAAALARVRMVTEIWSGLSPKPAHLIDSTARCQSSEAQGCEPQHRHVDARMYASMNPGPEKTDAECFTTTPCQTKPERILQEDGSPVTAMPRYLMPGHRPARTALVPIILVAADQHNVDISTGSCQTSG